MINKKSQISVEYVALISFVILIIMAVYLTSYSYTNSTKDTVVTNQASTVINNLIDNAEAVSNLGYPSKTTLKIYIPINIKSINISDKEITFVVYTSSQEVEISQISSVNLTGDISTTPGLREIIIEATTNGALIRE
ncbi:MAG: hypothetical protein KJ674_03725 [Nanoarchaeota archaeon]|nr:hypothetical protein [Nanoarchaeota archaeon]